MATDEGQGAVENALEQLIGALDPVISAAEVRGLLETWRDVQQQWRDRPPLIVCLADYDALLEGLEEEEDAGESLRESKEVAHAC